MSDEDTESLEESVAMNREVYITWCSLGESLSFISHSQTAEFLLNFYLTRTEPEENGACTRCGSALSKVCRYCLSPSKTQQQQQDRHHINHEKSKAPTPLQPETSNHQPNSAPKRPRGRPRKYSPNHSAPKTAIKGYNKNVEKHKDNVSKDLRNHAADVATPGKYSQKQSPPKTASQRNNKNVEKHKDKVSKDLRNQAAEVAKPGKYSQKQSPPKTTASQRSSKNVSEKIECKAKDLRKEAAEVATPRKCPQKQSPPKSTSHRSNKNVSEKIERKATISKDSRKEAEVVGRSTSKRSIRRPKKDPDDFAIVVANPTTDVKSHEASASSLDFVNNDDDDDDMDNDHDDVDETSHSVSDDIDGEVSHCLRGGDNDVDQVSHGLIHDDHADEVSHSVTGEKVSHGLTGDDNDGDKVSHGLTGDDNDGDQVSHGQTNDDNDGDKVSHGLKAEKEDHKDEVSDGENDDDYVDKVSHGLAGDNDDDHAYVSYNDAHNNHENDAAYENNDNFSSRPDTIKEEMEVEDDDQKIDNKKITFTPHVSLLTNPDKIADSQSSPEKQNFDMLSSPTLNQLDSSSLEKGGVGHPQGNFYILTQQPVEMSTEPAASESVLSTGPAASRPVLLSLRTFLQPPGSETADMNEGATVENSLLEEKGNKDTTRNEEIAQNEELTQNDQVSAGNLNEQLVIIENVDLIANYEQGGSLRDDDGNLRSPVTFIIHNNSASTLSAATASVDLDTHITDANDDVSLQTSSAGVCFFSVCGTHESTNASLSGACEKARSKGQKRKTLKTAAGTKRAASKLAGKSLKSKKSKSTLSEGGTSDVGVKGRGSKLQNRRQTASTLCDFCGKDFPSSSVMKKHRAKHLTNTRFQCTLCERVFKQQDTLNRHRVMNHKMKEEEVYGEGGGGGEGGEVFSCDVCEKTYTYVGRLHDHMLSHYGQESGHFACDVCDKAFAYQTMLDRHKLTHSAQASECQICLKVFPTEHRLVDHIRKAHPSPEERVACEVCAKTFASEFLLKFHMRMHADPFTCEVCGTVVHSKSAIKTHMRKHTNPNAFACQICGKTFTWPRSFDQHMATHSTARPCVCELCGKGFKTTQGLRSHKRSHGDQKKFACKTCNVSFRSAGGFWHHNRRHHTDLTDAKVFRCDKCDYTSIFGNCLRMHMKSHQTEKPFVCDVCAKGFGRAWHLKQHKLTHSKAALQSEQSSPVIFQCELCSQVFETEEDLRSHRFTHYPFSISLLE